MNMLGCTSELRESLDFFQKSKNIAEEIQSVNQAPKKPSIIEGILCQTMLDIVLRVTRFGCII